MAGVKATLDDTASMTMTSHIFNAGGYSIKYERCVLVGELKKNALDGVIPVAIDTETCCRGFEGVT
jgi:hypothetical protein